MTSKLIVLHPQYEELVSIRERWACPETRQEYRKRSPGERLVSRIIAHGCRQARGFGLQSATLQCYVGAMSNNLALLARVLAEREKEKRRVAA